MQRLLVTAASLLTTVAGFAEPDEAVVQAMTRATNLTPAEIRQDDDACDSGVTVRMKICASYHWIEQDVRLNRVYKQALAQAREPGYEASLVKSQRAWLAYRDAACTFEGEIGAGGGTAEGLYVLSCKEELTRERTVVISCLEYGSVPSMRYHYATCPMLGWLTNATSYFCLTIVL